MHRRKRHAVEFGVIALHVEIRQQRDIREESLESVLRTCDLRCQFPDVVQTVRGIGFLELFKEMILVEEVAEVRDEFTNLVPGHMLLGDFHRLRERRPNGLRLLAEQAAKRRAVLAALGIELSAELLPVLPGAHFADARQEADEAEERKLVRRIHEEAQISQHILGVKLFEDADAGGDPERDLHARQRHLHVNRLVVAAVENRNITVAEALVMRLADETKYLLPLRLSVIDLIEPRLLGTAADRTQRLVELTETRRVLHHHVRDIEDAGDGTVVAFELDDPTPLPALREFHDVLDLRATPRVDALEIVADRHDVAVLRRQNVRELRLESVRVLVFVDEYIEEVLLQGLTDAVARLQQLESVQQEVIEVHRIELQLAGLVLLGDGHDLVGRVARDLGLPTLRDELNALLFIRGLGDHLRDDVLLREVLRILHRRLDDVPEDLLLVLVVDDLKAGLIADERTVTTEEARTDRVEGSAHDHRRLGSDDLLRALKHLAGRAIGEGQKKNAVRRNALLDEVGDTMDERAGLARAGRGQDKKRSVARGRRGTLFGIEKLGEICHW